MARDPVRVCHKCAVRFDPICAKASADCFRAGLIFGKLLIFNDAKARKTLSSSPTLNQEAAILRYAKGLGYAVVALFRRSSVSFRAASAVGEHTRNGPIRVHKLFPTVIKTFLYCHGRGRGFESRRPRHSS